MSLTLGHPRQVLGGLQKDRRDVCRWRSRGGGPLCGEGRPFEAHASGGDHLQWIPLNMDMLAVAPTFM